MGLDNGINIRRNTAPECASKIFHEEEWKKKYSHIDVAYWRKCWNVRNIIFDLLDITDFNDSETTMTIDDVKRVIAELKNFNKNNYQDGGGCIWLWNEFEYINRRNIKQLKRLVRLMHKYPKMEVYFYDSW